MKKSADSDIIIELISDFYKCLIYYREKNHRVEEKKYLKLLSHSFFNTFEDHPHIIKSENAIEHLHRNNTVTIRYKDVTFIHPNIFVKVIKETKKEYSNLFLSYFKNIKEIEFKITLEQFLGEIFRLFKKVEFKLTKLDIWILRMLTDKDFMFNRTIYSRNNEVKSVPRIVPPSTKEILLKLRNIGIDESLSNIEKRKNILFSNFVFYDNRFMYNFNKLNFFYILIVNISTIAKKRLNEFVLWNLGIDVIILIPFQLIENELNDLEYEILDEFGFGINFQYEKDTGWENFNFPEFDFSEKSLFKSSNLIRWKINELKTIQIKKVDLELLKSLLINNGNSLLSVKILCKNYDRKTLEYRFRRLVKNEIIRLHTQIRLIGINNKLLLKIEIKDSILRENIIQFFSFLPEIKYFKSNESLILCCFIFDKLYVKIQQFIEEINKKFPNQCHQYNLKNEVYSQDILVNCLDSFEIENSLLKVKSFSI